MTAFDLMDGMRALAALTVLFSHERFILFVDETPGLSIPWWCFYLVTGLGHQAVMVFFVLSGYWITKTVVRRSADGGFGWSDYAIDRLSRLWIVLIPALLLGAVLDGIGRYGTAAPLYLGIQGTSVLSWDVATRLSPGDLVGNLIFLQTLVVPRFGSNASLWSLANEFWYYVWFPLLFPLLRGRRPSIAGILFVFITMVAFKSLLPGFVCWLCGSLLFYATQKPAPDIARRFGLFVGQPMAIAIFVGSLSLPRLHLPIEPRIVDVAESGSFALFLFALIRSGRTYPHWLAPLCRYGAGHSYSLYLVHLPLMVLLIALFLAPVHQLPPSCGLLAAFAGIGFVAIVYGYGVSAMTEANTAQLRRWLKGKLLRAAGSVA